MVLSVSRLVHFLSPLRTDALALFYPDPRASVRAHCFPIRVVVLWNRLPASVIIIFYTPGSIDPRG